MQPDLATRIDHTILRPEATPPEVHRVCTEAMQLGLPAACVPPVWVRRAATMIQGDVRLITVVGFPHGTSKSTVKAIEATSVLKDGADEIEVVPHLPNLLRQDVDAVRVELMEIVRAARATRRESIVKVIIESALLMRLVAEHAEAAIAGACRAARESGCDGIVTSTGFHPAGGASAEAVRLIRQHVEGLQVTATGGIDDNATALAMIEVGADRIGTESAVEVLRGA